MTDQVAWVLGCAVKDGQLDDLKMLAKEMTDSTLAEEGALTYEWSLSEDDAVLHVFERYRDDAAVMAHMKVFGEKYAARFMACVKVTGLTMYGDPGDQVRATFEAMKPTYLRPFAGFNR